MSKDSPKPQEKKHHKRFFKKGDKVFFHAFTKQSQDTFYMCEGIIEKVPPDNERQVFKVKILAVGDRPIGKPPLKDLPQSSLLNRTITKKFKELHKDCSAFMKPPGWLKVVAG